MPLASTSTLPAVACILSPLRIRLFSSSQLPREALKKLWWERGGSLRVGNCEVWKVDARENLAWGWEGFFCWRGWRALEVPIEDEVCLLPFQLHALPQRFKGRKVAVESSGDKQRMSSHSRGRSELGRREAIGEGAQPAGKSHERCNRRYK